VHGVELTGLRGGHVNALLRDDAQARGLDLGVDRAGEVALGGIGFDDRKGALNSHCLLHREGFGGAIA
jgi:hypothetical protein